MTEVVWSCTIIHNNSGAIRGICSVFEFGMIGPCNINYYGQRKKKTILEMYTHNKSKGEH